MARAMTSLSKAARSVVAPPPRTSSTTSTPRAATAPSPHATDRAAAEPCTRTSARNTREAEARAPQLVEHVVLGGAAGAGDQPDPQRDQERRRQLGLPAEQPLGVEAPAAGAHGRRPAARA